MIAVSMGGSKTNCLLAMSAMTLMVQINFCGSDDGDSDGVGKDISIFLFGSQIQMKAQLSGCRRGYKSVRKFEHGLEISKIT